MLPDGLRIYWALAQTVLLHSATSSTWVLPDGVRIYWVLAQTALLPTTTFKKQLLVYMGYCPDT